MFEKITQIGQLVLVKFICNNMLCVKVPNKTPENFEAQYLVNG